MLVKRTANSALKMEAIYSCEASVYFQRYIPEDSNPVTTAMRTLNPEDNAICFQILSTIIHETGTCSNIRGTACYACIQHQKHWAPNLTYRFLLWLRPSQHDRSAQGNI
jgi:hypothetical protein